MFEIKKSKPIEEATIFENGIRVYENVFCLCGCGKRILWKSWHRYSGISKFLKEHYSYKTEKERLKRMKRICKKSNLSRRKGS